MITDPIGDFLARIRNAQQRKKDYLEVPHTKMLESISNILKDENFIESVEVVEAEPQSTLVVKLRYVDDKPVIRDLVRVSKPGVRKYRGYREISPVKNGQGISIFSTPRGVVTGDEALKNKIGGEYLCYIY
ncbi:MAG: 30S ribosomal protein S8 [Candidatus Dojkabacteria bacterium]|nr:30S ribosomal protein S8 [Candidatus Dojkabacteria bacterium]MDQ7021376.1 30S ribosomal protein S8 [Candidatus Dojkabacteria bacterium]